MCCNYCLDEKQISNQHVWQLLAVGGGEGGQQTKAKGKKIQVMHALKSKLKRGFSIVINS